MKTIKWPQTNLRWLKEELERAGESV